MKDSALQAPARRTDGQETKRILIVDDDTNIAHLIGLYLDKEGWEPVVAASGDAALACLQKDSYALMLLDVMLPGCDGFEVLRRCRGVQQIPVIMITARDAASDKIAGLDLGADDYVTKPFDMHELMARVRAVLRRSSMQTTQRCIRIANLTIDLNDYSVVCGAKTYQLPPKQTELLYYLAAHPNRVFSREQLLREVWGYDYYGASRTVDVHVKRLRQTFADTAQGWQISTIWAVGYKFEVT